MEGLIVLIILFSIVQKIAEKVKENRQGKAQTEVPSPQKVRTPVTTNDSVVSHEQENPNSYNPQNPFGNWEEIFFPKPVEEPIVYKSPKRSTLKVDNKQIHLDDSKMVNKQSGIVYQGKQDNVPGYNRLSVDKESIRQGILWSEVLGPPKSKLHWRKLQKSSQRV